MEPSFGTKPSPSWGPTRPGNQTARFAKEAPLSTRRNTTTYKEKTRYRIHGPLFRGALGGVVRRRYEPFLSRLRHDFHNMDGDVADVAATLYQTSKAVQPTAREDFFLAAAPGFEV